MPIDYAALAKAGGISKGTPRKTVKARKARADANALQAFRDAVWERETRKAKRHTYSGVPRCQSCRAQVHRGAWSLSIWHGEVHHRIPRSVCTKAQRYDTNNGVLLCQDCHRAVQEHRITI